MTEESTETKIAGKQLTRQGYQMGETITPDLGDIFEGTQLIREILLAHKSPIESAQGLHVNVYPTGYGNVNPDRKTADHVKGTNVLYRIVVRVKTLAQMQAKREAEVISQMRPEMTRGC